MTKTAKLIAFTLAGTLALSACGSPDVSQTPSPTQTPPSASQELEKNGVGYIEFECKYYHHKLSVPQLQLDSWNGLDYYIQKSSNNAHEGVIVVSHYNEAQDGGNYDPANTATAEDALYELHEGKAGGFLDSMFGFKIKASNLAAEGVLANGVDAVRYEGTYILDNYGSDWEVGVTGFCIRGEHTPVLIYAIDLTDEQDELPELAGIVETMAASYVDGTGPDM